MKTPHVETVGPARLEQLRGESDLLVVDFWQQSCAPCRALEPTIDQVAERHPDVTVVRVDVDADLDITRQFDVMSIPTVLVLRSGRETGRLDGLVTERDLEAALSAQPDSGPLGRE